MCCYFQQAQESVDGKILADLVVEARKVPTGTVVSQFLEHSVFFKFVIIQSKPNFLSLVKHCNNVLLSIFQRLSKPLDNLNQFALPKAV